MLSPTSPLGPTYRLRSTLRPQNVVGPRPHVSRSAKGVFSAELRERWSQGGNDQSAPDTRRHHGARHVRPYSPQESQAERPHSLPSPWDVLPSRILLTASFIWPAGYLLPDLLAGPTYIDVHTKANPRGELRGQITVKRIS